MAAVYEAINVDIDKRVAIKLLAGHLAASQTVVERFLREARAVSQIRSPHICEVYDSGRLEDGTPFLVLELLEGESLYDAMCRDRQMSPQVTLAIILQVAKGLARAHEAGIVHRDLKPENIFLTVDNDGHLLVKILDFGLAKFYDPVNPGVSKGARLTREGAVFGTPAYMSPEQVRGQAAADTRADLWALACITYECFTGTTVWSTEDGVAMTFAQIATAPLPDPRKWRPDLSENFTMWFFRALDRDIERRFQSVDGFADELVAAFDYRASSGGLDAGLITRITHAAAAAAQPASRQPDVGTALRSSLRPLLGAAFLAAFGSALEPLRGDSLFTVFAAAGTKDLGSGRAAARRASRRSHRAASTSAQRGEARAHAGCGDRTGCSGGLLQRRATARGVARRGETLRAVCAQALSDRAL
jgi:serine/threonine protein kinase